MLLEKINLIVLSVIYGFQIKEAQTSLIKYFVKYLYMY